jgi:hypothetical protein
MIAAIATGVADACYNVYQAAYPENPPGKTGCVNANAPSEVYEVLEYVTNGFLNAVKTGGQCTYDCPGVNPNYPTCRGDLYNLSGTCSPDSAHSIRGNVAPNAVLDDENGSCGE